MYYEPAAALLRALREGGTPFELVLGEPFFDHLARHPDREAVFQGSMAGRSEREADDVVAAYDFTPFRRLVDVGGGQGILLSAILRSAPGLEAILLDRPAAIEDARGRLERDGHQGRFECVAGDFFVDVPAGADAYLLSRIIHDWEDVEARRILDTCRRAIGADGALLLVEAILPERVLDRPGAVQMDLLMFMFLGARERTAVEYEQLLAGSGFRLAQIAPTRSPAGLSVIEARAAPSSFLNARLADTFDLYSQAKRAYWNVKGSDLIQLHLLYARSPRAQAATWTRHGRRRAARTRSPRSVPSRPAAARCAWAAAARPRPA